VYKIFPKFHLDKYAKYSDSSSRDYGVAFSFTYGEKMVKRWRVTKRKKRVKSKREKERERGEERAEPLCVDFGSQPPISATAAATARMEISAVKINRRQRLAIQRHARSLECSNEPFSCRR